eukprot:scaffold65747_cov16-Tisochrysis_lutea.AAC.2
MEPPGPVLHDAIFLKYKCIFIHKGEALLLRLAPASHASSVGPAGRKLASQMPPFLPATVGI